MKTGGYDIALEMRESLVNKLALAYYYMGRFPLVKGTYVLPIRNVPPNLQPLTRIDYELKPGIPSVDFIGRNSVRLLLSADALVTVVGFQLKLEVGFRVEGSAFYDEGSEHLMVDLRNPRVTAEINDQRVSRKALDVLNEILATVLRDYVAREVPLIDVSPFVRQSFILPDVKSPLSLRFANFKVTDDILAAGLNVLDRSGGSIGRVEDFTDRIDLAFGISEAATRRVFDFWWDNGPVEKRIEESGESPIEIPWQAELFIDTYIKLVGQGSLLATLIAAATRLERVVLKHDIVFELDKPRFDLLRGNRIKVNGEANLHFSLKVILHYKVYNPAKFKWKHRTATIASWTDDVGINYSGGAALSLDNQGNLAGRLTSLTLKLRGLPKLIDEFAETLANLWAFAFVRHYPRMMLGSIPVSHAIPGTRLTLEIAPSLVTTDEEAYVRAGVRIRGLENYPPSPYIANRSPKALELHVPECPWLDKIAERHRIPYYAIEEAHADGYDNCHYCLGGSER